jgi:diguanylate cyclase (GGDEF)-like protein/PAS domain S-box-containing protein
VSRDETGEPLHRQGVWCDITDCNGFEGALERLNHQHEMILNSAGEGIFGLDSRGKVTFVNPAAVRMTGWKAVELLGRPLHDVLHHTKPDGTQSPDEGCPILATLLDGTTRSRDDEVFWRKDGTSFPIEYTSTPIFEGDEIEGAVVTFRDITDRKALEEKLQHQAFHDTLTGLPNRALFSDRLQHAVARTQRHGGKFAVLFLDLDNFKIVNDSLGHDAGDELLVGVAGRLRASLRPEDTAARLGGDEFALLLEDLADVGEATRVAKRIADKLRVPFVLDGQETFVTASIGIALGGTTTERPEDLLREADLAMYRAKHSGRARYALFGEAMSAGALGAEQQSPSSPQAGRVRGPLPAQGVARHRSNRRL